MAQVRAEQRFDFNEDRRRLFGESGRTIAFVCECDDPNCRNTVLLAPHEYDARRPAPIVDGTHTSGTPPLQPSQ